MLVRPGFDEVGGGEVTVEGEGLEYGSNVDDLHVCGATDEPTGSSRGAVTVAAPQEGPHFTENVVRCEQAFVAVVLERPGDLVTAVAPQSEGDPKARVHEPHEPYSGPVTAPTTGSSGSSKPAYDHAQSAVVEARCGARRHADIHVQVIDVAADSGLAPAAPGSGAGTPRTSATLTKARHTPPIGTIAGVEHQVT